MDREKYSFEQTQTEAGKMKDLVGKNADRDDYVEASEIVDRELIDKYQSFDKKFFLPRRLVSSAKQYLVEQENMSEEYRKLLSDELLRQILQGQADVDTLDRPFVNKLLDLARYEITFSASIQKTDTTQNLDAVAEETGLQIPQGVNARYFERHIRRHLNRLILPERYNPEGYYIKDLDKRIKPQEGQHTVPSSFGVTYIKYVENITEPGKDDADDIISIIGEEGLGVAEFWTYAPYVYDELQRKGLGENEAMEKIFDMVRYCFKIPEVKNQNYYNRGESGFDHLCRKAPFYQHYVCFLGYDERMPSHLLARLYAKEILEGLQKDKNQTDLY